MAKLLCIECKKEPVFIKKRRLCKNCYRRLYSKDKFLDSDIDYKCDETVVKKQHASELEFVRQFFIHPNWVHHPATFRVGNTRYTPDFYDGERNIFIEVVGTHQAFDANKEKYKQFIAKFPKIGFEVRRVNGEIIDLNAKKQCWT